MLHYQLMRLVPTVQHIEVKASTSGWRTSIIAWCGRTPVVAFAAAMHRCCFGCHCYDYLTPCCLRCCSCCPSFSATDLSNAAGLQHASSHQGTLHIVQCVVLAGSGLLAWSSQHPCCDQYSITLHKSQIWQLAPHLSPVPKAQSYEFARRSRRVWGVNPRLIMSIAGLANCSLGAGVGKSDAEHAAFALRGKILQKQISRGSMQCVTA